MKSSLAAVLALAALPLAGQEIPRIEHQPPACAPRERFWLVTAALTPPELVSRARVYFSAPGAEDYYFVDMAAGEGGQWSARLPNVKAAEVS